MNAIRTFLDTGVLISAARGVGEEADAALKIISDPHRKFASSQLLKLEVLPKAIFMSKELEVAFYNTYFESVDYWATDLKKILEIGYREAAEFGLGAMDAMHIAAALETGSSEFITGEKPQKSIHRTRSISVVSIASD